MESEFAVLLCLGVSIIFQVCHFKYQACEVGLACGAIAFVGWLCTGMLILGLSEMGNILSLFFYGIGMVNVPLLAYSIFLIGKQAVPETYEVEIGG